MCVCVWFLRPPFLVFKLRLCQRNPKVKAVWGSPMRHAQRHPQRNVQPGAGMSEIRSAFKKRALEARPLEDRLRLAAATYSYNSRSKGSFFSGNHQNHRANGWFLKRTMVENNGESTPRMRRIIVSMGMGQNDSPGIGPQVLVHVSTCQGNPFGVPIFDPQPYNEKHHVFF